MSALLFAIAFAAGIITAISPCVVPVLPLLLAGGASGGPRRPYAILAGLVASFTFFTLTAASLVQLLGLPADFLRDTAIALLFLLAGTLLVPPLGRLVERPFLFLTRRRGQDAAGGFLLGVSLGLVFVPCAGPVLAAVSVLAATGRVGVETVVVLLFYALGAAIPMLFVALSGRQLASSLRAHAQALRVAMGVLMALGAIAIALDVDRTAQTALSAYTDRLQRWLEGSSAAQRELAQLRDTALAGAGRADSASGRLGDLGIAPEFHGIAHWLNTPGAKGVSLRGLRGRVVLVDFWTYSCVNCLRTLPHLEAWDAAYRRDGLVIVGVHTPEFAFEHDLGNVRAATRELGIRYPVALDNSYATWNAYSNQYWPAHYLVDRTGHTRFVHYGEGAYEETEAAIRKLLAARSSTELGRRSAVADRTPRGLLTPETYLGYARLAGYSGAPVKSDRPAAYRLPTTLAVDHLAFGGVWLVAAQRAIAGPRARLRLRFRGRRVFLVLGGRGVVSIRLDGAPRRPVRVEADRLYTLVRARPKASHVLDLRFSTGLSAYAFTFG